MIDIENTMDNTINRYLKKYLNIDYIIQLHEKNCDRELHQNARHIYRNALSQVLQPVQNLIFQKGKRLRPKLTLLHIIFALNQSKTEFCQIKNWHDIHLFGPVCTLIEVMHNATLIADDIEDQSQFRRGIAAAHITYGIDHALNSSNWAYFLSHVLLKGLTHQIEGQKRSKNMQQLALRLSREASECLYHIHLGQALDIQWHKQATYIPCPEEYFYMSRLKTGFLFGFAAKIGLDCAYSFNAQRHKVDVKKIVLLWESIGQIFQALDDLLNISTGNPGKLRGDDFIEGKKSLPISFFIYQLLSDSEQKRKVLFLENLIQNVQNHYDILKNRKAAQQEIQEMLDQAIGVFLRYPGAKEAMTETAQWIQRELNRCYLQAIQYYGGEAQSGTLEYTLTHWITILQKTLCKICSECDIQLGK